MAIRQFQDVNRTRQDAQMWRGPISTLTYRSVATTPMAPCELERLLARAKARNHSLGVTGVLMLSDNQFFQWLEGPADSVAQVWGAIQADPRHSGVELLDHHVQSRRLFGDWDMNLVSAKPALTRLRDPADPRDALPHRLLAQTADLAVKGQDEAIFDGLQELRGMGYDMTQLHGAMVEPVARLLGDWWAEDRIGLVDISIGLAHLRTAVRRTAVDGADAAGVADAARHILVVPAPGEPHVIGAALVGDVFSRAGWRVKVDFPADAEALAALVRSTAFDAVSLCLSDVFERIEQIGSLAAAIGVARAASKTPNFIVLAGGRLFRTHPELAAFIGADATYAATAEAPRTAMSRLAASGAPATSAGAGALH